MKKLKELQVGKWYQSPGWSSKSDYAKLLIVDYDNNDRFHYSEVIVSGKYEEKMDWWSFDLSNIREIPLEEIQQYLPDNHPDKISKQEDEFLTNRVSIYVRYTKDFTTELFEAAMKYFKDNSEGIPRGMNDTYKGFQQETYLLYDNFNLHGEIVPKVLKRDLKGGYGYGVDNNRQGCQKELSIEGLKDFIGYKDSKSENKLPTQWYFKVTDENYKKFKDIRPLSGVYGYISSHPVCDLSWGLIYSDPPSGYTEISFEAFEKYVLSKEKTKTSISKTTKEAWVPKVGDFVWDTINKKCLRIKNVTSEDYFILEGQGATYKSQCRKAEPWEIPIEEHITSISTIDVPNGRFYVSGQRDPYDHFNYRYAGDPRNSIQQIRDKYYTIGVDPIEDPVVRFAEYPLTPKESFKTNKLPTKSWY